MSRFRLRLAATVATALASSAAPAAAQARVHVQITKVTIRTERAHPAVPTLRAVVTVCVRNTTTAHHRVMPTLRANFLLSPVHGHADDHASTGYTIPIELSAAHRRAHCRQRTVAGVVEDVERRLRISTTASDGVAWEGHHEVAPGFHV
jgi:hypothetical protein